MSQKQHESQFDVVISGGGMIGLSLAAHLGQNGFKIALIERSAPTTLKIKAGQFSPRVSAINIASERLLTQLGAWQLIPADRRSLYDQMRVWDGLGSAEIHFDTLSVEPDHLGHIIENTLIVDALWQIIDTLGNVEAITPDTIAHWQQDDHGVHIQTQSGLSMSAELLVGCEGKHSLVRQQSNINSWSWDYHHSAIVTTVSHEKHHQQTAQQVFLDSGPLAFLPLRDEQNDGLKSSIVWSAKRARANELMTLKDDDFRRELEHAFESRLGSITTIDKRAEFPLTAQQAKSYFDNRIVILGDAAHSIHPLAGLGVNTGFLDVIALAQSLMKARCNQTPISHPFVLRRFQRRRQTHNFATAALMEALKRLYDSQAPVAVLARNMGLKLVNQHNLAKRPLVLAAMGELDQL